MGSAIVPLDRETVLLAVKNTLGQIVNDGIFALGGQVAVVCDGELIVDLALGESGSRKVLSPGDLHNVYCLVKPFSYLLLAQVLENAGIGPDDLLDEVASLPCWCPTGITFRELSSHNAGLGEPSAIQWRWTPPNERETLLRKGSRVQRSAYSEVAGGLVCEHLIEEITGVPADNYCIDKLLSPLGLSNDMIVNADGAESVRNRVRAPAAGLPMSPLPMLSELLPSHMNEIRLALGALATMSAVAKLFAAVGRVMLGKQVSGLPSPQYLDDLLRDERPASEDPVLGREAKWSAGLMVELKRQVVSRFASNNSVGHVGGLANSAALFDPTRNTSVAVFLNGVGADFHDQALPRQRTLDRVLDAIPACNTEV
ncbi:MAG: serine hydrolase [bacterium]|nr:serine hydrolase [bacterium]